jgi:tight adherence protein B
MRLTPGQFLLIRWTLAAVTFLLIGLIAGWGFIGIVLAIIAALVGYLLPRLYVAWRTAQRMSRLETQFVQMLALVASSLRSGFSLMQALDSARSRCGRPLSDELFRVLTDIRFGRPVEEAFEEWLERVPSRDLRLIVTAISVQRHSGGNLSEILENLAQTMRERAEVRLQIRSLTAYARFTARIIAVYPLAVALLLTLMSPETWGFLWTEQGGWAMLGAAFVMNALAMTVMRGIARVDY